ncbi:hypothetical protein R8Z50_22320 [Longispora sp. K20-0274]|uniref:hypothetical protein n=1 Tax=Longispora sp. K20-0274 TaxID=3088255 RepID=UPI00399C28E7
MTAANRLWQFVPAPVRVEAYATRLLHALDGMAVIADAQAADTDDPAVRRDATQLAGRLRGWALQVDAYRHSARARWYLPAAGAFATACLAPDLSDWPAVAIALQVTGVIGGNVVLCTWWRVAAEAYRRATHRRRLAREIEAERRDPQRADTTSGAVALPIITERLEALCAPFVELAATHRPEWPHLRRRGRKPWWEQIVADVVPTLATLIPLTTEGDARR